MKILKSKRIINLLKKLMIVLQIIRKLTYESKPICNTHRNRIGIPCRAGLIPWIVDYPEKNQFFCLQQITFVTAIYVLVSKRQKILEVVQIVLPQWRRQSLTPTARPVYRFGVIEKRNLSLE